MVIKNYYKILGISRTATKEEIKKAYRKKVLQYHPDANPHVSSSLHFILVQEAYQILSQPTKKEKYDLDYDILYPISYFEKQQKGAKELIKKFQDAIHKCHNQLDISYDRNNIVAVLFFCSEESSASLILATEDEQLIQSYRKLLKDAPMCRNISTNVEFLEQILHTLLLIDKELNINSEEDAAIHTLKQKIGKALYQKKLDKMLPIAIVLASMIIVIIISLLSKK